MKPLKLSVLALLWNAAVTAAPSYVVGVEDQAYLPAYSMEGGSYHGYARDLLDAFSRESGIGFEYRAFPIGQLAVEFAAGHVDFKFPDAPEWNPVGDTGGQRYYSRGVARYLDGVFVLPAHKTTPIEGIRTLALIPGVDHPVWLERARSDQVTLVTGQALGELVRRTLAGETDAIYGGQVPIRRQHSAAQVGADTLIFRPDLPHKQGAYSLSTLRYPQIIEQFDAWLESHGEFVAELKRRHAVEMESGQ